MFMKEPVVTGKARKTHYHIAGLLMTSNTFLLTAVVCGAGKLWVTLTPRFLMCNSSKRVRQSSKYL